MSEVRQLTAELPLPSYPAVDDTPGATPVDSGPAVTAAASTGRRRAFEDQLPSWLLRAGLAFVLSYAATSSAFHPETFARYFPSFMPAAWATELLPVFAVFELLLAVGLMTERFTYPASMLAGLTMVAIVVVNPDAFDVLFRNVAIACGAFALAAQSRRERADQRAERRARRPRRSGHAARPGSAEGVAEPPAE
jgi:uncharacterized membrane protein YphA (DoxX/SURF4 family)